MAEAWHSTRWMHAVYDSDLPTVARFVARLYADMAGPGREAWLTNEELVRRTGASKRAVQDHRGRLVAGGWLTEIAGARRHSAPRFMLTFPPDLVIHRGAGGAPLESTGVQEVRVGVQEVHPRDLREIDNSSSVGNSPARAAPVDDDEKPSNEQDPRIVRLIAHHKPRNPTGWLRTITANGDLNRLIAELPPPTPAPITAWECPDHGHITTRRCGGCSVEIKTGQRPPGAHGQHYEAKETA